MALFMDMLQGEWIDIDNGRITIQIGKKTGRRIRLSVRAGKDIVISRKQEDGTPMETTNRVKSRDHPR
jgi:hypothetical protein